MNRKFLILLIVIVLVLLVPIDSFSQCAMCKQAAESSLKSNPNSMARSLNSGILYLMAVPYLMLCFIFRKQIATVWRKLRNKAKA